MENNLAWRLSRKYLETPTMQEAIELEKMALDAEVDLCNARLTDLKKQEQFLQGRLVEIAKEMRELVIAVPHSTDKPSRLREGSQIQESYYISPNYRSVAVRRGLGTPEKGGGVWLTEEERKVVADENGERWEVKITVDAETSPFSGNRTSRYRDGTKLMEARFSGVKLTATAKSLGVGSLRSNNVVWLTAEEHEAVVKEVRKRRTNV